MTVTSGWLTSTRRWGKLKGQNRSTFEDAMMKNARRRLEGLGKFHIWKSQSTVYVEPATDVEPWGNACRCAWR